MQKNIPFNPTTAPPTLPPPPSLLSKYMSKHDVCTLANQHLHKEKQSLAGLPLNGKIC